MAGKKSTAFSQVWLVIQNYLQRKGKWNPETCRCPDFSLVIPFYFFSLCFTFFMQELITNWCPWQNTEKKWMLSYRTHAQCMKHWNDKVAHFCLVAEVDSCGDSGDCRANRELVCSFFLFFNSYPLFPFHICHLLLQGLHYGTKMGGYLI